MVDPTSTSSTPSAGVSQHPFPTRLTSNTNEMLTSAETGDAFGGESHCGRANQLPSPASSSSSILLSSPHHHPHHHHVQRQVITTLQHRKRSGIMMHAPSPNGNGSSTSLPLVTPTSHTSNNISLEVNSNMNTSPNTIDSPTDSNELCTPHPFPTTATPSEYFSSHHHTDSVSSSSHPRRASPSDHTKTTSSNTIATTTARTTTSPSTTGLRQAVIASQLPRSPCFVHSLLDQGVSLADWLKNAQESTNHRSSTSSTDRSSVLSSSDRAAKTLVDEMNGGVAELGDVAVAKGLANVSLKRPLEYVN